MHPKSHNRKTIPYTLHNEGTQAILFIHGFLDSGSIWRRVIHAMRAPGYALVSLDLPGMGDMHEADDPLTLESLTEAIVAVIDSLGMPVTLVGQSMGCQIAELAAMQRPEAVKALALVTPVPLAGLPVPQAVAEKMCAPNKTEAMHLASRGSMAPKLCGEILAELASQCVKVRDENLSKLFRAWSEGHPHGNAPCSLNIPVLILGGENDPFSPPELIASAVLPRFKQARHVTLAELSHWPHAEDAPTVAAHITAFCAS